MSTTHLLVLLSVLLAVVVVAVLAAALEGLPVPAASLLRLVLGDLQDELTEVLRRFGAAETAGAGTPRDRDSAVMGILFGSPAVTAMPPWPFLGSLHVPR